MFVQELRHETEQTVRVGVLLKKTKNNPLEPIYGALLNWFYWRYLVKADEALVDIVNHEWSDIPCCEGLYYLTFTVLDTSIKGPLTLYIHDDNVLGKPILMHFMVIDKNTYDSKYGNNLLKTEPEAQLS